MKRYGMPGPKGNEVAMTLAATSIAETNEGQFN
jgi:hypothetical protein